jgi:Tol biopolymer transport system component
VDGGAPLVLGTNASLAVSLPPGDHGLAVGGTSPNCSVGNYPPIVTITAGTTKRDTTRIAVAASCTAVTGAITVVVSGTGLDVDSALTLFLDGGFPQQFRMGTPVTFSGISGGAHSIQLADVAGNCAVVGTDPQSVMVTTGGSTRDTALAAFSISCSVTTGVVQVTVVTTGGDLDADGYRAGLLDIGRYEALGTNDTLTMSGVPLGKHFIGLGNAAANCSVAAPNPREVTVTAGVTAPDTTKVTFTVSCVAFTGAVRATVTTSGIDPDPDGYQVQLVGLFHTAWLSLPSNGTALVDRLPPGVYVVRPIDGAALNCAAGGNPASITVAVGDTAALALAVDCAPAAQLAIGVANGATRTDIYSLKSNGAALVQLTSDAADERDPAWSFDGTRIAFVSDKPGNDEIYVMNADGTGQTRLTNEAQPDGHPTWSPNGTQIAFASHRSGNTDIWVMNADGSNPVRLTTNAAEDMDPAWSPDGTRIAFVSNRDGNLEVYVMNADGSNQTRITQTAVDETQPDWSPNGSQLVVSRFTHCDYYYGCDYDLVVMNADGSNQVTLPSTSIDGTPAWSPDGQWIAFGAGYCDYYYGCYSIGVWAIRPNGTGQTQIAPSGSKPTWRH